MESPVQAESKTWESANVAAIEEAESAVDEITEGSEDLDTEEAEEFADAPEDSDDDLSADEDSEDTEEEVAPSGYTWDGNPNNLPPVLEHEGVSYNLQDVFKSMQGGYTKVMQQLNAERKSLQEQQAELQELLKSQQSSKAQAEDPRPENPSSNMSEEEYYGRLEEIAEWKTRQVLREHTGKEQPTPKAPAPEEVEAEQARVLGVIQSQPDYTDAHLEEIQKMVKEDEFLFNLPVNESSGMLLYRLAGERIKAAEYKKAAAKKETESIRRKASSPRNAVSRSTSAPGRSAAENFKNMGFKEASAAALAEHGG